MSRQADRTASFLFALRARLWGLASGATDSSSGMTDNDRQRRDHNPENIGKTERTKPEDLTHKAIHESLTAHI